MSNPFKTALQDGQCCRGIWLTLCSLEATEIAGQVGFSWCLIDGEHGPNTLRSMADQLRVLAATPTEAVVRVPVAEDWVLKQVLDIGARNIMVPMVDDAETAANVVAATRYPPEGRRGMGAYVARSGTYGLDDGYLARANDEICVMVQAESAAAIANIDAIAAVPGVDVVFIGPADLSADMGHPGDMSHPDVVAAIDHGIARIHAAGKVAGILTFDPEQARGYAAQGVGFIGVGGDAVVLSHGLRALAQADQ